MIWEAWLTILVACLLLGSLALRVAATDLLAISCLGILVFAQNITGSANLPSTQEAVAGFGNKGLITIGLLFAVVAGLEFTGGTELATGWLLNRAKTLRQAQIRLLIPVAALSGFLNNTPVVAALLPIVDDVAKRISESTSRLLLPMSYAAILGGMCTIMGTSTNLIVREIYEEQANAKVLTEQPANEAVNEPVKPPSATTLSFFAPAWVGVPAAVIGLLYILVASPKLIPERKPAVSVTDDPQQYTVEMQVEPDGALVGQTIEEAGLRNLPGLYIAEIQRDDGVINAAKPNEKLRAGDALILVGALDSVVDLRKVRGLIAPDDQARKLQVPAWRRTLVEAVVSSRCTMLGKTIREGRFRSNYNAAVVAVARGGKRLSGKIGDVRLETGDVLLLEASPSFRHRQRQMRDFYLVSAVDKGVIRRHELAWLSLGIMLTMVVCAAFNLVEIMTAALMAAIAMIGLRCCTTNEARRSVDWSVLLVIGAAIGIGAAMTKSGAAAAIADGLVTFAAGNPLLLLASIYLATMLCTELITNNAAAVLMVPIALKAAPTPENQLSFVIAVMIAASASFLTPFGYQTNLMVYGVGGYHVSDYLRFGLPLSMIVFAVSMVVIPMVWGL